MRPVIITMRFPRVSWPRLEDIGAAIMAAPSPYGRTFESFMPRLDEEEPSHQTRH